MGLKFYLLSSHLGYLWDFPIATIAPIGQRIVGTKYFPPKFPTDDTENVPWAKSSLVKVPLAALSQNSKMSLLI